MEFGDTLRNTGLQLLSASQRTVNVENTTQSTEFTARHALSPRQIDVLFAGGLINYTRSVAHG